MEAIAALYGSDSDDQDVNESAPTADERSSNSSGDDDDGAQPPALSRKRHREEEPLKWKRTFAHVDGNWPSHVRVEIPQSEEAMQVIERVVGSAQGMLGADVDLVPVTAAESSSSLHLSLSRPFVLTYDQIEVFVDSLRAALKWRTRFRVALDRAVVLVNEEATRSFLALRVASGVASFLGLLKCVNKCMQEFGLTTYYEDPIPHVSIASALGDSLCALSPAQLDQLRQELEGGGDETSVVARVTSVQVVIGNKNFPITLR